MNEGVQAVVLAYEDAAIQAIVNTVTGLEHGTVAGERWVHTNELQFGAEVTWWWRIQARHFASILFTLQERDNIFTCRSLSITVLKGGADTDSIYGEVAVSVLTFGIVTS